MLEKLITSIYSAIDRSPQAAVALRVRHPGGFRWEVRDRKLFASTEIGDPVGEYDLESVTIAQLADLMAADGCTVVFESDELGGRLATILLQGSGLESESNGDALMAYESLLWSILDAYSVSLEIACAAVDAALLEVRLETSSGPFLDFWGAVFGIARPSGLGDVDYRVFIIDEVTRLKNNGLAIEKSILSQTGLDIEIFEPWKLRFVLDESALSGPHRFTDDAYYNYHIIQPVSSSPVDFRGVLRIVNQSRSAGVDVYAPQVRMPASVIEVGIAPNVLSGIKRSSFAFVPCAGVPLLDYMTIGDVPILQYEFMRGRTIRRPSIVILSLDASIYSGRDRNFRSHKLMSNYGRLWSFGWSNDLSWSASVVVLSGHSRLS